MNRHSLPRSRRPEAAGRILAAIARAQEVVSATPKARMPQQFESPANIALPVRTTAEEIAADFPDGLDALIADVGTGSHSRGCAQVLKPRATWRGIARAK